MLFSSRDQDNDRWNKECAKVDGGWWYNACTHIELNEHKEAQIYLNHQSLMIPFFEMKIKSTECGMCSTN